MAYSRGRVEVGKTTGPCKLSIMHIVIVTEAFFIVLVSVCDQV